MDTLNHYRTIVESVLTPYAERRYSDREIINEAVFDRNHDHYLVVSVGWQGVRRVQHCLLHLDIINRDNSTGTSPVASMSSKTQRFVAPKRF